MSIKDYFGVNFEYLDKADLILKIEAIIIAESLSSQAIDTMAKAMRGPMESGDTPSKEGRGELLEEGVLCQTCSKDSDYTFSVTYPMGCYVWKALDIVK